MTLPSRFWTKVDKLPNDGCWLWTGAIHRSGYGHYYHDGKTSTAHRVSYEDAYGSIPSGLVLDHLCRTRSCVCPTHLEAVTLAANIHRGVAPAAQNRRKTHCKRGHEFTAANTIVTPRTARSRGGRSCRTCAEAYRKAYYTAEWWAAYRAKRRAKRPG